MTMRRQSQSTQWRRGSNLRSNEGASVGRSEAEFNFTSWFNHIMPNELIYQTLIALGLWKPRHWSFGTALSELITKSPWVYAEGTWKEIKECWVALDTTKSVYLKFPRVGCPNEVPAFFPRPNPLLFYSKKLKHAFECNYYIIYTIKCRKNIVSKLKSVKSVDVLNPIVQPVDMR